MVGATAVAATTTATDNHPVIPGAAANAHVSASSSTSSILAARPAAIPATRTSSHALATDVYMHYLPRLHAELALGVATFATIVLGPAAAAVGTTALGPPDLHRHLRHAEGHNEGLATARIWEELRTGNIGALHTLTSDTGPASLAALRTVGNRRVSTTAVGIAGVRGALVLVIADHRRPRLATAVGANVAVGTSIIVVALSNIVHVDTTQLQVAGVVGAILGIITEGIVADEDAARGRIAGISRAGKTVIALYGGSGDTLAEGADVTLSAGIAVIAWRHIDNVEAADPGVTRVIGAGATIITVEGLATNANTALTKIPNGADITVRAGGRIEGEETAFVEVTDVVCAGIRIIALNSYASFADPS